MERRKEEAEGAGMEKMGDTHHDDWQKLLKK